jgi:hypothetical protein
VREFGVRCGQLNFFLFRKSFKKIINNIYMDYNYIDNLTSNIIQPKYHCFCGCVLNYASVKKHLKSEKHKIYVKAKLFDTLQEKLNSTSHTP